jgi:uroporphyrinogen-III synthase
LKQFGMESNIKHLLSTRPLPKSLIDEAAASGVLIEQLSFISTQPVQDEILFQHIKKLSTETRTVVFTSMNAVEAVAAQVQSAPGWKIYSIGNTTRQQIEQAWGAKQIVADAENAQRLGERLIDDGEKNVVFFCGNIRRDELPNKLRSEGGRVEEVIVYNTEETPVKLAKAYTGVLFFSPSAVHAFCRQNELEKNTVFFAIGKTTEEALRQQGAKKIVVAKATDKVKMTKAAIRYLLNNTKKG